MSPVVVLLAVALPAVLVAAWAIFTSNNLIAKRNRVRQCRSSIGVVIKQRNDLIPNLVSSVKAYMGYESELLARIAEIRTRALHESEHESIASGAELSSLLSRLNFVVEKHPELKADTQFLSLQGQMAEMERELQAVRRTYNAAVTDYNNAMQMFPASLIASYGRHVPEPLIEIPESETGSVSVNELFGK